jgi:rhodanese-related sulfurtransferase
VASADFYKELAESVRARPEIRIIPVVSKTDSNHLESLSELGLNNYPIVSTTLTDLGVAGVPTLAVVDDSGTIQGLWKGKLSHKQEIRIKQKLGLVVDDRYISETTVTNLLNQTEKVTIIDLQERDNFALRHFLSARNIPLDELYIRAPNELAVNDIYVVYGNTEEDGYKAQEFLGKEGFSNVFILNYKDFSSDNWHASQ